MKSVRKKRHHESSAKTVADSPHPTFSSELLTPEEERELLTSFWDCKSELGSRSDPAFPTPARQSPAVGALADGAIHSRILRRSSHVGSFVCAASTRSVCAFQASACFGEYPFGRPRRETVPPSLAELSDLLQEAVCGLMQAIDRFDVSHGTRLATYATWWIRQTLQIAVARQSHLVSLSPHHLQESDCCSRKAKPWPTAGSISLARRNWRAGPEAASSTSPICRPRRARRSL